MIKQTTLPPIDIGADIFIGNSIPHQTPQPNSTVTIEECNKCLKGGK